MFRQYIQVGKQKWGVIVYYDVDEMDLEEIKDALIQLDCPEKDLRKALGVLQFKNTGVTFSNDKYRMSIVCIAEATDAGQFVNTVVHEAKHVQSHICAYYNVNEDTEQAAYLIGHIVRRMYKMVAKVIRKYVRYIGRQNTTQDR